MNTDRGLWSDLPMSTGIAALVCYAGVFGDVIEIKEIAPRLGASGSEEFTAAFNKLCRDGRIIARDGFAALPHLSGKIDRKRAMIEKSHRLINSRISDLRRLGRNPLIKFVGVSGSLAAGNPTLDRSGSVDLDLFLIARHQCIWLYLIPRGIIDALPFKKAEPELCPNHVMDESSLEVTHRNFYTATEVRNLIPMCGEETYRRFLRINRWVDRYYPGFSGGADTPPNAFSGDGLNKALYLIYVTLCSIKWRTLEHLKRLSFRNDPMRWANFNRVGCRYGGYQAMVHARFARLANEWFSDLLDSALIEQLFPDELSTNIRKGEVDVFKLNAAAGLQAYDYGKY